MRSRTIFYGASHRPYTPLCTHTTPTQALLHTLPTPNTTLNILSHTQKPYPPSTGVKNTRRKFKEMANKRNRQKQISLTYKECLYLIKKKSNNRKMGEGYSS